LAITRENVKRELNFAAKFCLTMQRGFATVCSFHFPDSAARGFFPREKYFAKLLLCDRGFFISTLTAENSDRFLR